METSLSERKGAIAGLEGVFLKWLLDEHAGAAERLGAVLPALGIDRLEPLGAGDFCLAFAAEGDRVVRVPARVARRVGMGEPAGRAARWDRPPCPGPATVADPTRADAADSYLRNLRSIVRSAPAGESGGAATRRSR